jgi:hypothetical protein
LAAVAVIATLTACGSSHHVQSSQLVPPYSGRLYSVAAVKQAFSQLGLELHGKHVQPGMVSFQVQFSLGGQPAGRAGTLVVATRRSAVGTSPLPGREADYANVAVFTKSGSRDEIWGALSALRWGTIAQGKPASGVIVPGKSIGNIWLGERRKAVEKAFGPGTRGRYRGLVSYFGGHLVVSYEFHDGIYNWVTALSTRWRGYHTRSGIHVGSTAEDLRRLFVTCGSSLGCYVQEGQWPDALATNFMLRNGRVTEIGMGNA